MTQFQEQGFEKWEKYIPSFFSNYLRNYFSLRTDNEQFVGDDQAPNSHAVYGDPAFDMLMFMSTPDIEEVVGKKLIPTYTYARIYKNGSDLKIHSDRPECQYSVTLSLGGDSIWPISIKDYKGNINSVDLKEGDMMVYHGTELEHWRDKFEGQFQYQVFMHYVDADGEYKDRKYDGRRNIGLRK